MIFHKTSGPCPKCSTELTKDTNSTKERWLCYKCLEESFKKSDEAFKAGRYKYATDIRIELKGGPKAKSICSMTPEEIERRKARNK